MIASRDPAEMEQALKEGYGARDIAFGRGPGPFLAIANRVRLSGVSLHYCRYDAPTEIQFEDMDGFRQFFCLTGAGEIQAAGRQMVVDPATTGIAPPRSRFKARYGAGYSHLVLQMDEPVIRRQLDLTCERTSSAGLALPVLQALDTARLRKLQALALTLAYQFDDAVQNPLVIEQLQQALVNAFVFDNAVTPATDAPVAMASAARAGLLETYIQEHWNRALTVEDIARACGVSARSIFARFNQRYGVTPMAYQRQLRLEQAHRLLLADDTDLSVMDIALRCGFSSQGHFARRYREKYGRLPSAARRGAL